MPADILAGVFHFNGKVGIDGTINDKAIALGPAAIQFQTNDVDDEDITGSRALNVKGTGLGIATEDTLNIFFVGAARVDGGSVNGVARSDGEHRFVVGGKLAIEGGGNKFVALRRTGGTRSNEGSGEVVGCGMSDVGVKGNLQLAGEDVSLKSGLDIFEAAFGILSVERDGIIF